MKPSAAMPAPGAFTGRHMLMIMCGFFGVVIAVNIGLAVVAAKTFTGLVVENSYVASQTFDKDTEKLAADAAKDVHPGLVFSNGAVQLKFATAAGQALEVRDPHLTLGHAVSAKTDQVLAFAQTAPGAFVAPANLSRGNWEGKLTVTLPDGSSWERPVRVMVE